MKREEKGAEGFREQIIAENVLNLGKDTDIKIQKHRELPSDSIKTNFQRHIIVKFTKHTDRERIMKAARGKKGLHLQGKIDEVHSRSVHRNWAAHKGVARYICHAEWEKYVPRIL